MIKRYFLITLLVFCFFLNKSYAQKPLVNVNHFTGTANMVIPLFNVSNGSNVMPINLIYNTNGQKVRHGNGALGDGTDWQFNAGGEIVREVRGLPDDCKKDIKGNPRLGWLYNTNGTAVNNFSILNDNNTSTCTDEVSDLNYINTNFTGLSDTEPDMFSVNVPGLSFQLVFDNSLTIRTIPYKDVSVTYTTDANGAINSFKVVDDKGTSYLFADVVVSTKTTKGSVDGNSFFKTEYDQYTSGITYNSSWKLSTITDVNGNSISMGYDSIEDIPSTSTVYAVDSVSYITSPTLASSTKVFEYTKTIGYIPKKLVSISYGGNTGFASTYRFTYGYRGYYTPYVTAIIGGGKEIDFQYKGNVLKSVAFSSAANDFLVYKFDYNSTVPVFIDSSSRQIDYWAFIMRTQI